MQWVAGRESRALGGHWGLELHGVCSDSVGYPPPSSASRRPSPSISRAFHRGRLLKPQHMGLEDMLARLRRPSSVPPSVVHEQLPVQLLVAPGRLHRVQQLFGLDELWVPLPVLGPGHQAPDVCPLPLDLRVH